MGEPSDSLKGKLSCKFIYSFFRRH